MNIEQMKLADIIPYKGNAKKHDNRQIKNVMQSIKEYGIVQPLVIDKNNVLIIGHCRLEASKRLKLTEVPVVRLEELSEEEAQKLRLLDNKLNESEWDMDLLADQVPELNFDDFDIDWGLDIDDTPAEVTEDTVPEEVETRAKLGDIWQLGGHRLICGDSTDIKVIERLMDGIKADMVFTDPPYNVAMSRSKVDGSNNSIKNDNLKQDDFVELLQGAFSNALMHCKTNNMYWWIGFRQYSTLENIFKMNNIDIANCIVWDKGSIGLGGKGYRYQHELCIFSGETNNKTASDVWQYDRSTEGLHPTMKPIKLVTNAIENIANVETVLDLFGGSGSTLIACEQLKRKCFMCELDPHYCDVILQRYINFKGSDADVFLLKNGKKIPYSEANS